MPRREPRTSDVSPERDNHIAAFVRERRKIAKLTQRQLSELAQVGPRAIWDLERGKPTVRLDVVVRVLRVFGKTVGVVDAPREDDE
jgi:HTH-type transcriptional regulator/antitoxin HipB